MTRLPPACCRMSAPNRPAKDRVIDQDGYVLEKVTNSSCDGGETKLRSCTASSLLHTRYMRRELAPHTVHCVIKGGLFSITISMAFHSQCRTAGRGSREGTIFQHIPGDFPHSRTRMRHGGTWPRLSDVFHAPFWSSDVSS